MKVNWHKVYVDLGFAIKNKCLRSLILEVKYCLQNTILQCYEQKWTYFCLSEENELQQNYIYIYTDEIPAIFFILFLNLVLQCN